jgi:hypothetical protein
MTAKEIPVANVQKPHRNSVKKEDPGKKVAPGPMEKPDQGTSDRSEGQGSHSGQHRRDDGSKSRSGSNPSSVTGDEDSDDGVDDSR